MVQSKKYQNAIAIEMEVGIYITCNKMPKHGEETENILSRLEPFETAPLKEKDTNAPTWIREHAMECVVWLCDQIKTYINLVQVKERFYEKPANEILQLVDSDVLPEEEINNMRRAADGNMNNTSNNFVSHPSQFYTIHLRHYIIHRQHQQ